LLISSLQIQWLVWHPPPQIQWSSQLPLHTVSAMFGTPLPIPCTNCHDKQLTCKAHPHTKGSCYHCIVKGLPCLFPPNTILRHGSPDAFCFRRNCVHCTQSHQKCIFNDTDSPLQCKRCMKLEIPCLFQLSSQGSRNDLNASADPKDATMIWMKSAVVCEGRSTELDWGYLSMQTRVVFTITIVAIDIAATVVLNRSPFWN